jgi:hypothetical protein
VREGERSAGSRGGRSSGTCATPHRREVPWFKRREGGARIFQAEKERARAQERLVGLVGEVDAAPGVEVPRARKLGPRARRHRPRV